MLNGELRYNTNKKRCAVQCALWENAKMDDTQTLNLWGRRTGRAGEG